MVSTAPGSTSPTGSSRGPGEHGLTPIEWTVPEAATVPGRLRHFDKQQQTTGADVTDQETEKPGSSDEEYRFRPGNLAALQGRPMTTWAMPRRLPQLVGHAPGGPPSPRERSIPLESRTFGHTSVTLPHLEEPGLYLTNVAALEASRGIVQEFQYTGLDRRSLELASTQLVTGRISGIRADRVVFSDVRLNGVEFIGCDLSSLQWRDSKLSRVVFRDCKIMGGMLAGLSIETSCSRSAGSTTAPRRRCGQQDLSRSPNAASTKPRSPTAI